MKNLQQSVLESLDACDATLYPYLPYLLQDFWEIGVSPDEMIALLKIHKIHHNRQRTVLDLGCGKGAVSVRLAREFGFTCHGVDAMPEFVQEAREWAERYHVSDACRFEVGDIRIQIEQLRDYDLVILGAIGPVFGNLAETLVQVRACLKPQGYVLLDDGYIADESPFCDARYLTRTEALMQIHQSRMEILEEEIIPTHQVVETDEMMFQQIKLRASELSAAYPDQRALFEGYVQAQAEENTILEQQLTCVTWLLQRMD